MLKDRLGSDLKQAMLARDHFCVETLRTIKAAILNEEVAKNLRDSGLDDSSFETLIAREIKKRHESAGFFDQGGNSEAAAKERAEAVILQAYLPKQLDEAELIVLIQSAIQETGAEGASGMGKVIGAVKAKVGNTADGATIARLVKDSLK